MSILTYAEYCSFNTGTQISESEFDTLSFYGDMAVSSYILPEFIKNDGVKKAAAMQIALSKESGGIGYYVDISAGSSLASEHLGDYSYSKSFTKNEAQMDNGLFPMVAKLLAPYRVKGVKVQL